MKPAILFVLALASSGTLLGQPTRADSSRRQPATLLENLVGLTRAGSSEATVLAYAKAHRLELPPEVSDRDLRWLQDAGVSQTVVRYMSAIDVRASDELAPRDVGPAGFDSPAHPSAYSSGDDDGEDGSGQDSYADVYDDNSWDSYSEACPADYGCYPCYDYAYYPYPSYLFANRLGFFARSFRRDHQFAGRRGLGQRPEVWRRRGRTGTHSAGNHVVSRDAWRGRGRVRPALARGGPRLLSGRATGSRGFGPSRSGRGGALKGFRAPRQGAGSFGSHHTGGAFSHGSRGAAGSAGGRARR